MNEASEIAVDSVVTMTQRVTNLLGVVEVAFSSSNAVKEAVAKISTDMHAMYEDVKEHAVQARQLDEASGRLSEQTDTLKKHLREFRI